MCHNAFLMDGGALMGAGSYNPGKNDVLWSSTHQCQGAQTIDIRLEMHNQHHQQTNQPTNKQTNKQLSTYSLSWIWVFLTSMEMLWPVMNASDIQRFANSLTGSAWKCRLHFNSVVWYDEVLLLGFELFQRITPKKKNFYCTTERSSWGLI